MDPVNGTGCSMCLMGRECREPGVPLGKRGIPQNQFPNLVVCSLRPNPNVSVANWGNGNPQNPESFDCEPPAAPGGTAIPGPRPDMVQAPEARHGIKIRLINWMVYDHRIRD